MRAKFILPAPGERCVDDSRLQPSTKATIEARYGPNPLGRGYGERLLNLLERDAALYGRVIGWVRTHRKAMDELADSYLGMKTTSIFMQAIKASMVRYSGGMGLRREEHLLLLDVINEQIHDVWTKINYNNDSLKGEVHASENKEIEKDNTERSVPEQVRADLPAGGCAQG